MSADELAPALRAVLEAAQDRPGPRVFLTGAGISAESGIPTFRGAEGFWTVGSRNYRPQELATYAAFRRMPEAIWSWFLHRRWLYGSAVPNPAHVALAELESRLEDDFLLITQNIDGLHLSAGNSKQRTYQIHGDIRLSRCAGECSRTLRPIPQELQPWERGRRFDAAARELLTCPACGDWLRPHVLWFDEYYDEDWYRFESSMAAAAECGILVVVGTSGATNLPMQVAAMVAARRAPFVVVDPEDSVFSAMAKGNPMGHFAMGTAGRLVPAIVAALTAD
jgi:NAD-dependent deacetylase